ncbi:tumor necrosis factor receptor superfamily member 14 [Colossoma macropomum]|uniref:tumor necrosis factor receptor superfamily member 14 n=1 Tax=Colossoma macropomum TaxID=42526 RepID=UPI001863E8F4|nr:tumor necrosis factor receptor superfamily member 14 [Colossoma macropomum]
MMVKALLVVMVILAGGLSSALPLEAESRNVRVRRDCKECPAGQYLLSCSECSACSKGSYTSQVNSERTCHPCFKNCVAAFHMQVVKACSSVSDVVCRCMDGFFCSEEDPFTGQCSQCEPTKTSTSQSTTTSTTLLSSKPTPNPTPTPGAGMLDVWILIVVLLSVLLIIFIMLHLCRQYKKECLKKLVKRCSHGNQKLQGDIVTTSSQRSEPVKHIQAEEVHPHTPTSTCSASDGPTPQPVSTEPPLPAAGNLGPLHIYGANTVFVSLLNQFGQNAGEKDDEDVHQRSLNESELHCPTSPLPLSTEERNRDSSYISFPSQEQGKECHMSKEEGL